MEQKKIHKNRNEVQSGECRKYLSWEHSDQTKVNLPKLQKKKIFQQSKWDNESLYKILSEHVLI